MNHLSFVVLIWNPIRETVLDHESWSWNHSVQNFSPSYNKLFKVTENRFFRVIHNFFKLEDCICLCRGSDEASEIQESNH